MGSLIFMQDAEEPARSEMTATPRSVAGSPLYLRLVAFPGYSRSHVPHSGFPPVPDRRFSRSILLPVLQSVLL